MSKFQENVIPAANQNEQNVFLHPNTGIKVMFVGNSITKHAPKIDIGWTNDCGMAATELEKDYVHLMLSKIRKYDPNVSWCISQAADLERRFTDENVLEAYKEAEDFEPDIMIFFFGANVNKEYADAPDGSFGEVYRKFRMFLDKSLKAKVFHSEGFYIRPLLDKEKWESVKDLGDTLIPLDDIRTRDDAHGKFNHPGDLGMSLIAERFWEYVEPAVKELSVEIKTK